MLRCVLATNKSNNLSNAAPIESKIAIQKLKPIIIPASTSQPLNWLYTSIRTREKLQHALHQMLGGRILHHVCLLFVLVQW